MKLKICGGQFHDKSDLSWGGHQETELHTLAVASPGPGVDSLPDMTAQSPSYAPY